MRRRLLTAAKIGVPILALVAGWLWWVDHKARQLWDEDPKVKARAVRALGKAGPLARPAVPELVEGFMSPHSEVCSFTVTGRLDGTTHVCIKGELGDALVSIGSPAVGPLCEALLDPANWNRGWEEAPHDHELRMQAPFRTIAKLRAGAARDDRRLEQALREIMAKHGCVHVRLWAGQALGIVPDCQPEPRDGRVDWASPREELRSALEARANDPDDSALQSWANDVLRALLLRDGPPPREFSAERFEDWLNRLEDDDALVRAWAAHILRDNAVQVGKLKLFDRTLSGVMRALEQGRNDPSPNCYHALDQLTQLLRRYDCEASAIPFLVSFVENADRPTAQRCWSAGELGYIRKPECAAPLARALDDPDYAVSKSALHALGRLGDREIRDPAAIPGLVRALDDPELREYAASQLADYGAEAAPAVPTLIEVIKQWPDPGWDPHVYRLLKHALWSIDREEGERLKAQMLKDEQLKALKSQLEAEP